MFLQNISWLSTNYTALYPRRQKSSISSKTQSNYDAKLGVQLVHFQNVTSLPKGYVCPVTIHDRQMVNTDCCFNYNGTTNLWALEDRKFLTLNVCYLLNRNSLNKGK
jgi:hypothetical protein